MSFVTKEWKDRLAEFAGRRKLTNVSTGEETTVDVSRAEGEVSQAGDAFSAANMNDLEQRIKDGFDKVDTNLSNISENGDAVLLSEVTHTDDYHEYTLLDGITLSNFRYIYTVLYMDDDLQIGATNIIPINILKNIHSVVTQFSSGSSWRYGSLKYVSETKISAYKRYDDKGRYLIYAIK